MKKNVTRTRLGDLWRIMWKAPGKTVAKCMDCDYAPSPGISYANAMRECRAHSRDLNHRTRVVSIEIVEYRPEQIDKPAEIA